MNNKGLSLIEMLIVVFIFSVIVGGIYATMYSGQQAWRQEDIRIQLKGDMRNAIERMSSEIRLTGSYSDQSIICPPTDNTTIYITVSAGAGSFGTDIIRFSIPVICESTGSIMDVNGNVSYWRAPLTWGCKDSSCMDADDDCFTNDYDRIEYRINSSNELVRNVLAVSNTVVRTDIIAHDVTDLQAQLNSVDICQAGQGLTSSSAINLTLQMSRQYIESDSSSRTIAVDDTVDIMFRNLGEDVL